jgi:hypothetical protein
MARKTVLKASSVNENTLQDKDDDTKIQVEESADEDKIRFDTAGSQRMIITNDGKVGIGTDAPAEALDVNGNASIAGDVTCNNINIGADSAGTGRAISSGNTDTSIRFSSTDGVDIVVGGSFFISCDENASQDTIVMNESGNDIDFRVESSNNTHQIYSDAGFDLLVLGSDAAVPGGIGSDTTVVVSGSMDGQNNAVFTGNLVVSGSLTARQKHIHSVKYSKSDNTNKHYIRWNANGSNSAVDNNGDPQPPGVNNRFICPAPGTLTQVFIRSDATPGNTVIGFHRASDGTENTSSTPIETQTADLSTANTTKSVQFTAAANFGPGDILTLSVNPTNTVGNVDMTVIFEFDFVI